MFWTPMISSARSLAAMRVQRIASLEVACITPPPVPENMKDLGSLSMLASQSMTTISSSLAAGHASQLNPTELNAVQSISPTKAAELTVAGKNAKKLGLSQCVIPGIISFSTSLTMSSNDSGRYGGVSERRERR